MRRKYYHSKEVKRWMDIGRRRPFLGSDWYHYLLQDTNNRRPIR